jgi:membrane protein insertase Oxa1/YidC/SpoIIIJ
MTVLLDTLLLQPLMVIYRALLDLPMHLGLNWGVGERVIAFSVMLNLFLHSMYRQMESGARKGREQRERMDKELRRMKTHFKGRERYFYVRAVHRQFHHHPIQSLFTSNELFMQLLIFASVYHFLAQPGLLDGMPFGRIDDLSKPDGLLAGINLLPLLMTGINAISVLYYVKDSGQRTRALALALGFLVLLYTSPAGLVLYWTMNNFWSLLRNMLVGRVPLQP